ncbi:MAG TPA: hypothetical protein VN493_28510 [Thermoanaerobaculia bacterium]|nr:hypothetical protein [Thermoanaerobaculia bacterium]
MAIEKQRLKGREWLAFLIPVLAVTASLTLSYLWNEDFWWYLSSGRYLLENRSFPSEDPFLYSSQQGLAWVHHSWLWTVVVAVLDRMAGLGAVVVFQALLAMGLCALIYTTARVDRWGLVNALAVTLFLATISQRLCGKAEVATWLLLAVFYRLLDSDEPFTWKRGAALGALQVLWANLHGGYPLGVFIALCYSFGPWIESRIRKTAAPVRRLPLWFPVLLFVLAVADPRMFRERLQPFAFVAESTAVQPMGETGNLILEWQSPFRVASTDSRPLWLLVLAAGAGIASFAKARRRPLDRLLFFLGMTVLGASAVRHLPGLSLAAALVILSNLKREEQPEPQPKAKRKKAETKATRPGWLYPAACGLLAFLLLGAAVALRVARPGFESGEPASFFTVRPAIACPEAADFILERGLPGPIFNDYRTGAYLSARLYPRHRLFVDSRVMDPAVVVRYTRMVESPALWKQAESRYGFKTVILDNYSGTVRSPLGQTLQRDPSWRLVYLDPHAVIFVKDGGPAEPVLRTGRVPFVEPAGLVPPLPALQRTFLNDFSANYLIEYLSILGQLGRTQEVSELATEALRSMDHPLLYRQRCAANMAAGNVSAAVEDCEVAYRQRPDDTQVVALYATVLNSAGRRQEALLIVREAMRENRDPMLNRVWMSLQR